MNKFLLTTALTFALAVPALAQGMAAGNSMSGPSHMAQDDKMKMDHKKPAKKSQMKHGGMGMSNGMTGPSGSGGMAQGAMSNSGH